MTAATTSATDDFQSSLKLISAAVAAGINLIQLREKSLSARVLYELTVRAVGLTRGSNTSLLVNDRADIAQAAGAAGVHLTTSSLSPAVVRRCFGSLLIGVSTHSLAQAAAGRAAGADFAVYGPVFETDSKRIYGAPIGLGRLAEVTTALRPFPIIALGGITLANAADCVRAGARGIAGISLFKRAEQLDQIVKMVRAM